MKHGSLHGYYKLNPLGNDALAVVISMNAGAFNAVGAGGGFLLQLQAGQNSTYQFIIHLVQQIRLTS